MSNHIPENAIAFGTASLLFAAFAYGNQRAHRIQMQQVHDRMVARRARIERKREQLDRMRRVRRALETA